jgi:DNA-binding CsgD family transcriptional regulator
MGRLSRTDLERALRFATLAGEQPTPREASDEVLLNALWKMIDSEYASYERSDETLRAWLTEVRLPSELPSESIDAATLQLGWQQDPFIRYRRRTNDLSAVRLEDVVDMRSYRRTEYAAMMAEASVRKFGTPRRHILSRWVRTGGRHHGLVYMERTKRKFSSRDRLVLDAVADHLSAYERRRAAPISPQQLELEARLTARESELLDLMATGATNAQMAQQLWISPETVRTHLEHIYLKLGVSNRTAALARTGRSHPVLVHPGG